ncbi:uncharacterized protein EV154DRAFT_491874 [Mucor mucedo]|uniref:uncharacterized protein n=1 Tax=Mucor mucedo TaxID=29922 RepID=UPI002220BD4A|nr:uncharacterized protein EV154DRAFT_491874 [Mucor mucedo]KAI7896691.1 hypothetical protein EV154DRAFT_491874 [Mucor mucedo]
MRSLHAIRQCALAASLVKRTTRQSPPMTTFYTTEMYCCRVLIVAILVLAGGFFAGLTLGLMGLDETNLQVMLESGSESEKKNAQRVLDLLNKGKYWVLVTLLLSNVIVNETLPIVLDSLIGGGYVAVLLSTALIVIFGEVIPQSICVRYGLAIGAKCSAIVLVIMYMLYPITYPTACALDFFLGETHGTIYKKAGLKSLVSLHRSDDDTEGLTEDEVHIIASVLDLRETSVTDVMTPIAHVFTLTLHTILDPSLVHTILRNGYSRIPITHSTQGYIGMLLVKHLIAYDPHDQWPVHKFPMAPLPQTFPDTSCLDILKFFQEGKSHMAIVSNTLGIPLGVITLEDVIEGLIGEEIVDETDVFVNVHKRIRVGTKGRSDPSRNVVIHSPLLTTRSSENTLSEETGIKIRMKGYGAIVDHGSLSTSFQQQQQQQQQCSHEPKL